MEKQLHAIPLFPSYNRKAMVYYIIIKNRIELFLNLLFYSIFLKFNFFGVWHKVNCYPTFTPFRHSEVPKIYGVKIKLASNIIEFQTVLFIKKNG